MKKIVFTTLLILGLTPSSYALLCGTQWPTFTSTKSTVMTDSNGAYRIWKKSEKNNLTYCISNRFKELKPKMIRAMEIATNDWSTYGNITFKYVPEADKTCRQRDKSTTLFRVTINPSRRYRYAARAFFPYDEKRNAITFKKSYVEKDFEELLRLTRHELGHVLGLRHEHIRHENPYRDNCKETDNFTSVTRYDIDSVMHYSHCGGTGTTELSAGDREGIAILYPRTES